MCDGVAVPYVTAEMFPLLCELADDAVLVSEDEVRAAITHAGCREPPRTAKPRALASRRPSGLFGRARPSCGT